MIQPRHPDTAAPARGRLDVFVSASASDRLARARDVVRASIAQHSPVLIVGASRGAADDLAREVAASCAATFGVERLSLTQLAARTAIVALAAEGSTPSTWLGAEAVAARAVFDATRDASLRYFAPVADTPGFPRALARTLQELRIAGAATPNVSRLSLAGPDLADLLERFETCFADAATADRATLMATAAGLWRARQAPAADDPPPPLASRSSTDDRREPSADRRRPAADRQSTAHRLQPTVENRPSTAESRLPTADPREPGAESRERTADTRPSTAESRGPTADRVQPIAESRAPRAERREPTAERREPSVERRRPAADRQPTAHRLPPTAPSVVFLDVPLDQAADRDLVEAVIAAATATFATVPAGDRDAVMHFVHWGAIVEERRDDGAGDLACLRRFLFSDAQPPERTLDGALEFFSAPGEGRECVEIARRLVREARRGTRFDEMAVLVRSPHSYFGLLEHALRRADVPAYFSRGTRRPHPAGRAFLALLACAADGLSASRFAEYLSLGQVPREDEAAQPVWAASSDEVFGRPTATVDDELEVEAAAAAAPPGEDDPVVAGTLRAPWKWERLLVDAAVIGRDSSRWKRRLDGKAAELRRQAAEASRQEEESKVRVYERTLEQLEHLRAFALPIVDTLASWPARATWGEWLDEFERLAPRVLRIPAYVLRVLADLRPMAEIGPIDLGEARRVLAERLLMLESDPPSRRHGRVFVGTPHQARGRSFRVVFVPGLAERLFPQKPREDPLLLDELRAAADVVLPRQRERLAAERLLLQLAAGAASERLYVSYPRIELGESRARVPSFYALDIMRAVTGRVPDHETLEQEARTVGHALLAWPAPADPDEAIDDQEHDLAVLRRLLDEPDRGRVRGHAHYLLKLNEYLRRSVVDRWAKGDRRWSPSDGLTRVSAQTKGALAKQRLTARSYSLTALQRFSACPYQFLLAGIYRLQPLEQPEPLQRLDPLTRGSLFHDIQARFFRQLQHAGELPVTKASFEQAWARLDGITDRMAEMAYDELAPAVERVWIDEIASIRRDLRTWLEHVADDGEEWLPLHFELAFGPKVPGDREHLGTDDVIVEGGFRLRGAVDLVEEHRQTKLLRVTDHKTGRKPDRIDKVIVGGGAVLQPVLYAMALEAGLRRSVSHGRLFYCTAVGSFHSHPIPLNDLTRAAGLEVLQVIDRSIENGFLAAAPGEGACGRCDFRPVCGADVHRRVLRKPQDRLADLLALRSRP